MLCFLELVLPRLHFALLRSVQQEPARMVQGRAGIALPLSAREAEILSWIREGKSNYEIGSVLGISALTVKNHFAARLPRTSGAPGRGNTAWAAQGNYCARCRVAVPRASGVRASARVIACDGTFG